MSKRTAYWSLLLVGAVLHSGQAVAAPPSVSITDCGDSSNILTLRMVEARVYIRIDCDEPLSRIDLSLTYNSDVITFLKAEPTGDLAEWEFFDWRHYPEPDCGDSCEGLLTITSIADMADTTNLHPEPTSLTPTGRAVLLRFLSTKYGDLINECASIDLLDDSCGGIVLTSASGDSVFVPPASNISCLPSSALVIENVLVSSGTVCIIEPPDDLGDINLNGVLWDVGDAALFNRFLAYGDTVLDPVWKDVQILGTDINDDGAVGTVTDLRELVRLIARGSRFAGGSGECW
jgi:hypothetical protein